jgi:hypothetical protein
MLGRAKEPVWFLVMILCLVLALTLLSHRAEATTVMLYPTDDSFVRVGAPDTNFDEHSDEISVTAAMGDISDIGYLRFDVSSVFGTDQIDTVTLRLYNQVSPGIGVTVALYSTANDDWNGDADGNGDETTLTYNNAPAEGSALATATGSSGWMEFSSSALATYVNNQLPVNGGDGLVTLRVEVTSGGIADINNFEDRENGGGTGNEPELAMEEPTVITLVSFTARGYDGRVEIGWVTASEIDTDGFYVRRREGQEGSYTRINPLLIPSRGGPVVGATYHYTDEAVTNSTIYYYQLEEVDIYGHSTLYGPVPAMAGTRFWIYLPSILSFLGKCSEPRPRGDFRRVTSLATPPGTGAGSVFKDFLRDLY